MAVGGYLLNCNNLLHVLFREYVDVGTTSEAAIKGVEIVAQFILEEAIGSLDELEILTILELYISASVIKGNLLSFRGERNGQWICVSTGVGVSGYFLRPDGNAEGLMEYSGRLRLNESSPWDSRNAIIDAQSAETSHRNEVEDLVFKIQEMCARDWRVQFHLILREANKVADAMAKRGALSSTEFVEWITPWESLQATIHTLGKFAGYHSF
ncbi:hypothetical protein PIB30_009672 [Stylosanthes scabra]|uniref:RNase H type-1 domain-containing protein n=1 Tax=Stylosanthes scabra TaxID=79078 RepID=A0ABU6U406_9FABA|nr:hypothetical protein [Stylosanthes scabra]